MPEIKIGGYAPSGSSHSEALAVFAASVVERSEGRLAVDVLENVMDLGRPAVALLEMVESGELDLCYFSTSYLGDRVNELNVLETPFLFGGLDQAHRALDGELGAALTRATERSTPYAVLGYWDNGFRHLTNRLRPVRTPADLKGMRVRLQPNTLHESMVEAWGGVPVAVELSRGIQMISDLEVDAQENPLANTVAYGVDEVHHHATMTGHLYGARGVYANAAWLTSIGERDRSVIEAAVGAAVTHQRACARRKEDEFRLLMESRGVTFVDPTDDELAEFIDAVGPVCDAARATYGTELFDLIRDAAQ